MIKLRNHNAPVYLQTSARRRLVNIRKNTAATRFAYQAAITSLAFLLIFSAIICYAIIRWYK